MMPDKTQKVVIAGNGYLPYLAALFLQRNLRPQAARELLIIDLGQPSHPEWLQSLGSMKIFHSDLEIPEVEFVRRTQAEINLGFDYSGFRRTGATTGEIFSDSQYGFDLQNHRFRHLFHKLRQTHPDEKFEDYCLSARLARANRFTPPSPKARSLYASIQYGYRLSGEAYQEFLAAKLPANLRIIRSAVESVALDAQGAIASVLLATGARITGDFFIDATESRILKKALGLEDHLPLLPEAARTGFVCATAASPDPRPYTNITAIHNGLQLSGHYRGQNYQTTIHLEENPTLEAPHRQENPTQVAYGTRHFADRAPWVKNCIALGQAFTNRISILIDNSHLHQNMLLRLLELWPRSASMAAEARAYNGHTLAELRHLVDLDRLHLALACDGPDMLSGEMRYKVDTFKQSGKVAYYEKEPLQESLWPVLFNALGVTPGIIDLSVKPCTAPWLALELSRIKSTLAKAAAAAPPYSDFIKAAHR